MESAITSHRLKKSLIFSLALFCCFSLSTVSSAQEQAADSQQEEAQLSLRKTLRTREYQGKLIEGEERVVSRGDSWWRILIEEKGLSEKRFHRYLVIVAALNFHLKNPTALEIGDTIFIPMRPEEIVGIKVPSSEGSTPKVYRVKRGDHLFKIIRKELGIRRKKKILNTFMQIKELNPRKKNWNLIFVGERILFPGRSPAPVVGTVESRKPVVKVIGLDYGRNLLARNNPQLLEQLMGSLGYEMLREGEELLPLEEGTVRMNRDSYPVIHNSKTDRKVILDLEGKVPSSLQSKLEGQGSSVPIVKVKKNTSLHETVDSLLSSLGYQSMPSNQPIVVQDGGVGVQVKGEWMVTTPEDKNQKQEIYVISLTDESAKTPDYLKDYLSIKGMKLKEIVLPSENPTPVSVPLDHSRQEATDLIKSWPEDKNALVDALFEEFEIPFTIDHPLSVSLSAGIRLDVKADRFFEYQSSKIALIFQPTGNEVKRALRKNEDINVVELNLSAITSRGLITRFLNALRAQTVYREHRFSANENGVKDKFVLAVSGFLLSNRSLFLTDREIPKDLHQFFAKKGLRIVYFR